MDDVKTDSRTQECGEFEITIRNKRTGEIRHQEVLTVFKEDER
jgi:hypothetical protein